MRCALWGGRAKSIHRHWSDKTRVIRSLIRAAAAAAAAVAQWQCAVLRACMGSFDGVGHRLLSDAAVTRSTIQPTDRPTEHRASCLDPSSSRRRDVLVGADNTRQTTRSFATDSLLLTVELNYWNVSRQIYSRTCRYWIVWRRVFFKDNVY